MKTAKLNDPSFSRQLNASMTEASNAIERVPRTWISGWLTTPATAGDRLVITHGLGKTPDVYALKAAEEDGLLVWHKREDRLHHWNATQIVVRFSAEGIRFRLAVESID